MKSATFVFRCTFIILPLHFPTPLSSTEELIAERKLVLNEHIGYFYVVGVHLQREGYYLLIFVLFQWPALTGASLPINLG